MLFDIIFRGGQVVDGTGKALFASDVAVSGEKIAAVGDLSQCQALKEIDIHSLVIAPGFIDIHTHSDVHVLDRPRMESKVRQGVTTDVIGNCGFSPFPAGHKHDRAIREQVGHILKSKAEWNWGTLAEYGSSIVKRKSGLNIAPLVGHTTLRLVVMGAEQRRPTLEELGEMQRLLAETMEQGAFGISTGLTYFPSSCAEMDEIIDLAFIAGRFGGIYTTHSRLWAGWHAKAVDEAIEIGRKAELPVQISHQTIIDPKHWGEAKEIVGIMEEARLNGVDVAFDVYPYVAGACPLSQLLPGWVQGGGTHQMLERLSDPEKRNKVCEELQAGWFGGIPWDWNKIIVSKADSINSNQWQGKSLNEIASILGVVPIEGMFRLIENTLNRVDIIMFNRIEDDVKYFMNHPLGIIASDSYYLSEETESKPHPRNYGTFPRVLGRYVREQNLMSIEKAIYKMTGFPSERLGLKDRGHIAPGFAADLVVLDPVAVIDEATYLEPCRHPTGIPYVLVNGKMVIDQGSHTGALPGQLLSRH